MILGPDHLSYLSDQTMIIDAISTKQLILIQPVHNSENFAYISVRHLVYIFAILGLSLEMDD